MRSFPGEMEQTGENTAVVRANCEYRAYASLRVTRNLATAWMAYRGYLETTSEERDGLISPWAAKNLVDSAKSAVHGKSIFALEERIEFRRSLFSDEIQSRLKGFYVFATENDARMGSTNWRWPLEFLTPVYIEQGSKLSIHDASWINYFQDSQKASDADIDCYLNGCPAPGRDPIWELVVSGRAAIGDTALREGAMRVLESCWTSETLDLIEFCRIAALLGSKAGSLSQFVKDEGSELVIAPVINMGDFNDPAFMKRFWAFVTTLPADQVDWERIKRFQSRDSFTLPSLPTQRVGLRHL